MPSLRLLKEHVVWLIVLVVEISHFGAYTKSTHNIKYTVFQHSFHGELMLVNLFILVQFVTLHRIQVHHVPYIQTIYPKVLILYPEIRPYLNFEFFISPNILNLWFIWKLWNFKIKCFSYLSQNFCYLFKFFSLYASRITKFVRFIGHNYFFSFLNLFYFNIRLNLGKLNLALRLVEFFTWKIESVHSF
jgi:hypothetical protein